MWHNIVNDRLVVSMVSTVDESQHAAMKRLIAQAYSPSTLVEFEPFIDSTRAVLFSRLDDLSASSEEACNLGKMVAILRFRRYWRAYRFELPERHVLERLFKAPGSSYRIDLTGHANRKCLPSLTSTRRFNLHLLDLKARVCRSDINPCTSLRLKL